MEVPIRSNDLKGDRDEGSFAGWRQLVGGSSDLYSPTTWIYITAAGAGKATLVYRYWGVSGSAIVEDEARQVITAVTPSLMAKLVGTVHGSFSTRRVSCSTAFPRRIAQFRGGLDFQ